MSLNTKLFNLLIGTLLGDAYINKNKNGTAFIRFEQSLDKEVYLKHLYEVCQTFIVAKKIPSITERFDNRYKKLNRSLNFTTKSLYEFNFLAELFLDQNGKKVIPINIKDYLTLEALAYWICDDGQQVKRSGLTLCTDSFSLEEIELLRDALYVNFNLETSIHFKKGKNEKVYNRIYIKKSSLDLIKLNLAKHIHPSMLYKLNLDSNLISTGVPAYAEKLKLKPSIKVEILDNVTSVTTIYNSLRSAALALNCSKTTFINAEKRFKENGKIVPYKGRYVIKILRVEK